MQTSARVSVPMTLPCPLHILPAPLILAAPRPAVQSAELCRLNFPDKDWMHLVGLIHGLGKLLAHPM